MIEVKGTGTLRNSNAEIERALEILKFALHKEDNVSEWTLRYGEIPVLSHRVDAILEIRTTEGTIKRIGVEVVTKQSDISKNRSKLKLLRDFGELDEGYVVVMSPNNVVREVVRVD